MSESCEKSLRQKTVQPKSGLEANGLKMNIGKTKVMFGCSVNYRVAQKGKWPGGVCKKEVGNDLIFSYTFASGSISDIAV